MCIRDRIYLNNTLFWVADMPGFSSRSINIKFNVKFWEIFTEIMQKYGHQCLNMLSAICCDLQFFVSQFMISLFGMSVDGGNARMQRSHKEPWLSIDTWLSGAAWKFITLVHIIVSWQKILWIRRVEVKLVSQLITKKNNVTHVAVSYTHLDVYKRQQLVVVQNHN